MSRCSYCRCELPGLESFCNQCLLAENDRLTHPKPWWHWLRPRFARGNLVGFCFLFLFFFALLRFDIPEFRVNRMRTTETSVMISSLIACLAFFRDIKTKSEYPIAPANNSGDSFDWGRFMLLAGGELVAGVLLYVVFMFTPIVVPMICGGVSFIVVQIDIFDPKRTKSLGYKLCGITAIPSTGCLIVWRMTDKDIWLRLMLVFGTLMAGLIVLDRREDSQ
jgi:hypothetical protein